MKLSKQSTNTTNKSDIEYSKAWWEGYHCQGPKCHNPYPLDTRESSEWNLGWFCRYYGEKP